MKQYARINGLSKQTAEELKSWFFDENLFETLVLAPKQANYSIITTLLCGHYG